MCGRGCPVQAESVQYRLRNTRSIGCGSAVQAEGCRTNNFALPVQGVPKKISIKSFYSDLLTASIYSF